ncbi:type II toxin-antitoxin system Phd/YefM family antitoxin [Spelaeicoccus albus]|uniref:type II toxin-antitoxin system Phd/YefM family antitoxin n=1 Tax=Spelaeicoccus albus TaxID=1280376 RepID=UPI0015C84992|nr:type II toxin-antitoxin system prevent-host-death family antitoxin [Spelaeicoccus albus]
MDVTISRLRAELATWIERAQDGEEIVITDRGTPVARLSSVETAPLIEQLTSSGVLTRPRHSSRPEARSTSRVRASGPVADLIGEPRR